MIPAKELLAAKRLTRLVVQDEITRPLRQKYDGQLGYLLNCPYCVSVWTSFFITLLGIIAPKVSRVLNTALALAEVQALWTEYEARRSASDQDYGEAL